MASRMKGKGMIYALDINKGRLRILEETAKLQNLDDVITTMAANVRNFVVSQNICNYLAQKIKFIYLYDHFLPLR
ncbi:hypothetical protein ZOSMA_169G00090 [Zostera marina]|uniref:Uncharacterized protein n=1 Tax=Zostera marina TaxID=29655 RepID=A0A0K9PTE3_ZOSMR|nr:hypothetical protein ZOSMA_169G00090 [Zostera marina]